MSSRRNRPPPGFVRTNYDSLNNETFGESSSVGGEDWMASHDAYVKSISSAAPSGSTSTDEIEEVSDQLRRLWPSTPEPSTHPNEAIWRSEQANDTIWSSPELPHRPSQQSAVIGASTPPSGRVLTVEELEHQLTTPQATPTSETTASGQSIRPPPGLRMPQLPPHPLMGHGLPLHLPPHFMLRGPGGAPSFMRPHPLLRPQPRVLLPPAVFHHPTMRPRPPLQHQEQSDFAPRKSRRSEHLSEMKSDGSGFMTKKEKEWVIKIQLIQLQSADPSNEDYYYMNYIKRKQQVDFARQIDQPDEQQILALPTIAHEERKYTPAEFSGALGKLTVSSVGAPRRRMDVGVAGDMAKDIGRKKQALIVVEKLYLHLLELEELERKALALPEGDRVAMVTHRDQLRAEMVSMLQLQQDSLRTGLFQLVLTLRKGKRLLCRMLPLLADDQARWMLLALLQNLVLVIKKDSADQVLSELSVCVSTLVSSLPLSDLNACLEALINTGSSALIKIAQNDFGARLLNHLLTTGFAHTLRHDRSNQLEVYIETWHRLSGDLTRDLLANSAIIDQSKPATATLMNTLPLH